MLETLLQLIVLFFVIFDPLASLVVFVVASAHMKKKERNTTAGIAVLVAAALSFLVLVFGQHLLNLFSASLDEFRVAGGIILGILGVKMSLGLPLTDVHKLKNNSARAIAALIATPLLTGPAAITAIILSVADYGRILTGIAVVIVLGLTAVIFYQAQKIHKFLGKTTIQVMSTILGLITLAWGVKFIVIGINAIISSA